MYFLNLLNSSVHECTEMTLLTNSFVSGEIYDDEGANKHSLYITNSHKFL